MSDRARTWTELLTVVAFCGYLFYFGLGSFGLVGADEPRYAQIAREMLARHDWVTPVLYGKPWLEKPILYYWEAMLAYAAFGISDWAARLPATVSATAMVVAIYFFLRRFRPGTQLDGALICASFAAVIGFARAASTDMPLAAMFTIAMLGWLAWFEDGRSLWLAVFYAFLALATLAKGPVAPFLAGAIIVVFALTRRDLRIVQRTLWLPGILLFCAVALPWYVAVQVRTPEFFRVFILEHNLARFGTNMFRHKQPLWYYLPVLLLSVLPWTVLGGAALVRELRTRGVTAEGTEDAQRTQRSLFLVFWIAVPLVIFSLSQSKLPGYILPAVPPFALLTAQYMQRQKLKWLVLPLHSALAGLVLGAVLLMQYGLLRLRPTAQALLVAAVAASIVFVAMTFTLRFRGAAVLRFVTMVPVILALAFILKIGAPALDAHLSARPVGRELERMQTRPSPLAAFNVPRDVEYGLAFYRNQPVERYERAEIPKQDHLLVARSGSEPEFSVLLPGRRVSRVGGYEPQRLEFYWISNPPSHEHH